MAENIWDPNPPKPPPEGPNPGGNKNVNASMRIVGLNLLVLAIYTILCAASSGGMIFDAFLIFFHVTTCIILSLAVQKWVWFLSGLMVLIIGFSTCAGFLHGL